MNINAYTQAELHNSLALLFLQIQYIGQQINAILVNTEKFDAEISMRIIDELQALLESGNQLLIDSYHRQGLSDADIELRAEVVRKLFDNDS
jgi:predicted nicotinamide N-methyase